MSDGPRGAGPHITAGDGAGTTSPSTSSFCMATYFFDTDDGSEFFRDDVGVRLPNLDAAKREATLALAEIAADVIAGTSTRRELSIGVRDERANPSLEP